MLFTWLRSFHSVAREGGFTAASRALQVSQSTVSIQVRMLEDRFGAELFFRRGHAVSLTESGRALFEITRAMIGHEDEAARFLSGIKNLTQGHLRIGAIGPAATMQIVEAYRRRYPAINVSITVARGERVLNDLFEFAADVVILAEEPKDSRIHFFPFGRAELLVVVHKDHPLAKRKTIPIEKLAGQHMMTREQASTTRLAFERAITDAGVTLGSLMQINSREAIVQGIIRKVAISVIPESEYVPYPQLKALRVSNADMFIRFFVGCLAARANRPLIASFLDEAKALSKP